MRQALKLHPDSRCDAVTGIVVDVARHRLGELSLQFLVTGNIGNVRMPPLTGGVRADELWRHTCFEAFLRAASATAYYEFNLSPSCQWAAYRLEGYRHGMNAADIPLNVLVVGVDGYASGLELQLGKVLDLSSESTWKAGLSAVIEETNGRLSYWALAHPPGKPDFHHPDCFALELPAA